MKFGANPSRECKNSLSYHHSHVRTGSSEERRGGLQEMVYTYTQESIKQTHHTGPSQKQFLTQKAAVSYFPV